MSGLFDLLGVVVMAILAGLAIWVSTACVRSAKHLPEMALASVVRQLPSERRDWGVAMVAELAHVRDQASRWLFALGGVRVALALLIRSRRRPGATGLGVRLAFLAGVAACVAVTLYAVVTQPGAVPVFSPAPGRSGAATVSFFLTMAVLGMVLASYLFAGLLLPRMWRLGGGPWWIGLATALLFTITLAMEPLTDYEYDDIGYALPATAVLFPAASALAAASGRSMAAGMQAAFWSGTLSALAFLPVSTLTTVHIIRTGMDPSLIDEYRRAYTADLASFQASVVSEHLAASVILLALLPAWALFLGLLGGAVGSALRGRFPLMPPSRENGSRP
jgi:hypothetical protein